MARINFDDDVESKDEFWKLLPLVGGDRDRALGMLVRFFRFAQSHYGKEIPMSEAGLEEMGLLPMISSGWAIAVDGGYQVRGADKHFAWYRQKTEAGKKSGVTRRTKSNEDERPLNGPGTETNVRSTAMNGAEPPAPAPAPAPARKEEYIYAHASETKPFQAGMTEATSEWLATLKHFKITRPAPGLIPGEDFILTSAIRKYGLQNVIYALSGARNDKPGKNYDPSRFVSLNHYLDSAKISRFISLGSGATAPDANSEMDWDKFWKDKDAEAGAS